VIELRREVTGRSAEGWRLRRRSGRDAGLKPGATSPREPAEGLVGVGSCALMGIFSTEGAG
jgi:hypothetical protein